MTKLSICRPLFYASEGVFQVGFEVHDSIQLSYGRDYIQKEVSPSVQRDF